MKSKTIHIIGLFILVGALLHATPAKQDSIVLEMSVYNDELQLDSLQHHNYQDLGDFMWLLPGVWIRDLGSAGQWTGPRIQGSTTSQVDIRWDGMQLNDPWTGRPDLTLLPAGAIGQISRLSPFKAYALPNLGGTMAFETRPLTTSRPYTKVQYKSASEKFSDLDILFSQQMTQRWRVQTGVRFLKYGSSELYELSNSRKHQGQTVFGKLSFQLSEQWAFHYYILSNQKETNLPYSVPAVQDTLIINLPRLRQDRRDESLSCTGVWNQIHNEFKYHRMVDETTLRDRQEKDQTPLKANLNRFHWDATVPFRIPIHGGIEFSRLSLSIKDSSLYRKWNQNTLNGWFGTSLPLTQSLHIFGKMTLNHDSDSDWKPLLQSELQSNFGKHSQIALAYRTAHRLPTPVEQYGLSYSPVPPTFYQQTIYQEIKLPYTPNADLKSESGNIIEMKFNWTKAQTTFSLCGYHRNVIDMIEPGVTTEGISYQNKGEHQFIGMDAKLQLPLWKRIQLGTVFSYLKAEEAEGSSLLERPYTWGNSSLSWKHNFFENDLKTTLTVAVRYWSDFHTLALPYHASQPFAYQPANFAMDVKLLLIIMQHGAMGLSFDNILNRQIYLVDSLGLRGRVFRFDFSWELFD